jgi:hypothetical protein
MAGEMNFGLLSTNQPAEAALAPIKGMGAVNALQAQQLQNDAAQFEMQNALAEQAAYKQAAGDVTAAQKNLMGAGLGKQSVALGKAVAETEQSKMKALAERLPVQRDMAKDMAFNPSNENVIAHLQDQMIKGWITPDEAKNRWARVAGMNEVQRKEFFLQGATKAEDTLKLMEDARSNKVRESQAQQQIGISAGHLNLAQREFATKQAEKGPEGQVLKDIQSNTKALKTAGYDPTTGEDKVSDLIKQSTSGMGQALTASAIGALGGGTTSGMKAIGQLDTISKTMTLDLLNNKLGAGISNADRDALEARFGSIANPNLPADQRLAAWTEAKEIMRKAAMLPEVKGSKSAGKSDGVDQSNPLLK